MIPIYPKKCKKSNKSKKKVVDLGCTRRFHFFKVLKSTKKEPFPISYFLLEAPWDAYPSISRSLKFRQATYAFADVWGSWDVWTSQMSSWWLVWTWMLLSPPQMSCWSSSGGIRDGGKSRNAHVQFIPQNGNPNMAWATQGGLKLLLSHKWSDWPMGHHQM